jgi:hypothetical protein
MDDGTIKRNFLRHFAVSMGVVVREMLAYKYLKEEFVFEYLVALAPANLYLVD